LNIVKIFKSDLNYIVCIEARLVRSSLLLLFYLYAICAYKNVYVF
jgi:hypothetical protein